MGYSPWGCKELDMTERVLIDWQVDSLPLAPPGKPRWKIICGFIVPDSGSSKVTLLNWGLFPQ